jgi:hypothetical protein
VLVNVSSNVPAALSKSVHPGAKAALAEICNAEDMAHALVAVNAFEADCGAKWPKAVVKITEHVDVLLAFYDYPAEHWLHLRTTNPIESTFATVRLRQRVTKDPARGPPESRWRSSSSSSHKPLVCRQRPHLVALVRAGARFEKGALIERPD